MRTDDGDRSVLLLGGMLLISLVGHVVTVLSLPDTIARPKPPKIVEMEMYVPPPPPPPKVEEEKPPEPPKELEKPKVKPLPVVKVDKPPPPKPVEEPPPPNQEPPAEPPKAPVPIVVGISMSSTTAAGGFAVQVGNTTYGKASDKIVDPSQVKAYVAPKYAPPGGADVEPELVKSSEFKPPYPPDAKSNDIEGTVRLRVKIDAAGVVQEVSIVSGPGYGLNEAAREAMKKYRFKPAMKHGEPVGYELLYNFTWLLD
ncbi:MAG TPA: TonB family protein [Archangium sp.]